MLVLLWGGFIERDGFKGTLGGLCGEVVIVGVGGAVKAMDMGGLTALDVTNGIEGVGEAGEGG